ncbi:hypothetical protein T4D_10170 [Trichinella pseudospiralis]|uniref:Uncharacterized protein n=1 Tax=Trichinella pseudospiralis TaxID=6337 RepID=A0A0V1EHM4_TRIPS|nr:hypothetical protein T4D_10170 [Trichinella pseudospiralis]
MLLRRCALLGVQNLTLMQIAAYADCPHLMLNYANDVRRRSNGVSNAMMDEEQQ